MPPPALSEEVRRRALLFMLEDLEEDRGKIEQARREWVKAFDAIRDPVFLHDANYRVVRVNRAYAERAGSDIPGILGRPYWEVFPRRAGPLPGCRIATEDQQDGTAEEFTLDTGEIFVSRAFVIRDAAQQFLYAVHVLEDVTEQRRAEAERRLLSGAVRQSNSAMLLAGPDLCARYANPAFTRLFGYALEEISGSPVARLIPSAELDVSAQTEIAERVRREGSWSGEVMRRARDGTVIPVHLSAAATYDEQGRMEGYVGSYLDLRPIRQAQGALAASEARFRLLTENASDLVTVIAADGTLRYVSPSVQHLLGYAQDEINGHPFTEYLPPEDVADTQTAIAWCISESDTTRAVRFRLRRKDGSWGHFEALGHDLRHEPAVGGIVLNSRDITKRKEAEEALLDLNRMLKTLSTCNVALVHATNEPELLQEICHICVQQGGYRLAWVGFAAQDETRRVVPQAAAGVVGLDVLRTLTATWDDSEYGRGSTGRAFRTGRVQVVQDVGADASFDPWREQIRQYGIASTISLPLRSDSEFFGVLSILAGEPNVFDEKEVDLLTELADDLAFGIHNLRTRRQRDRAMEAEQRGLKRLRENLEATVGAVAATVEMRDPYTAGHERRVAELASAIAREMDLPQDRIDGIHFGALIHDLGKIRVPAELLSKPTALTKAEFELVREHAQAGYDILKGIQFPWPVAEMALQHHEHVDGSGYPNGLKGDEILLESRILAVADTVEAMSSHRPYRPTLGVEAALAEINAHRGTWYDADAVDTCLRLFREKRFTLEHK